MKKVTSILVLILFSGAIAFVYAQDAIALTKEKDGREIYGKATEIGIGKIVHTDAKGQAVPIPKADVLSIQPENGAVQVINPPGHRVIPKTPADDKSEPPFETPSHNNTGQLQSSGGNMLSDGESAVKTRTWFIEGGFSLYVPSEDVCAGFMLSGGYYFSNKDRVSLELIGSFNSIEIGTFTYTWEEGEKKETCTDGVIKRHYTFAPILLSWGHELKLSDKLELRVGPSLGVNRILARTEYTAKSHDVSKMKDKPGENANSENLFAGGAAVALDWRLFKSTGIGFSYRILANKSMDFETWYDESNASSKTIKVNSITHHIGITYWWKR
jgi:hypothetical protein